MFCMSEAAICAFLHGLVWASQQDKGRNIIAENCDLNQYEGDSFKKTTKMI